MGAVVFDHAGRLLLVRRVNDPGAGCWSLPGGRVDAGETDHQAVRREVSEEAGLRVEVLGKVGSVRRPAPDGSVFDIHDYACRVIGGALRAGSDADNVCWSDAATLTQLPIVEGLVDVLTEWGCLPTAPS